MTTVREELESAWNPNDMVLAVFPEVEASVTACQSLQQAGFESADIAVFRGEEATEHFDIEGKRSANPLVRPIRALWSYFSIEGPQLRVYEQASEAGQDIVAVKTLNDDEVAKAHQVLRDHGGQEIRYFTQWNIAELPDNESGAT